MRKEEIKAHASEFAQSERGRDFLYDDDNETWRQWTGTRWIAISTEAFLAELEKFVAAREASR